jgi:DNA-directed RNA polymerase sigma subunit (sigma70/sigma32)
MPDDRRTGAGSALRDVEEMFMPRDVDSDRYAVTSDSLQAYLRQITTIPLLSREEEVALATRARGRRRGA